MGGEFSFNSPTIVSTSLRFPEGPWRRVKVTVPLVVGVQVMVNGVPATIMLDASGKMIGFSPAITRPARAATAKKVV